MAQLDQMALKQSMLLRVHPPPRDHRELDDDSIIKLQLDNANKVRVLYFFLFSPRSLQPHVHLL